MSQTELPPNITIVTLSPDDLALLEPLLPRLSIYHNAVATAFSGIYPVRTIAKQLDETRKEMAENRALVEVVRRDGQPAGFAKASFEDGLGFVDWLYLDEDLRGLGLGKTLLDRLLAFFRANRVRLVDLMVVKGNPARDFYQKSGFATRLEMMSMQLDG